MLIDGHLRAETTPDTLVPVNIVDLTPEEADTVLLTHDSLAGLAGAEEERLEGLLAGVQTDNDSVRSLLDSIREEHLGQTEKAGRTDPDAVPAAPKRTITKAGDLWLLGQHRLLCGDATKGDDLARLMNRKRAALVFTDPPYGVAYQADGHAAIQNDELTRDALVAFLAAAFRAVVAVMADSAAAYIWHASTTRDDFTFAMRAAGLVEHQYLIWVKPSLVLGRADYQWQHEPCFYAAKDGHRPAFYGDRSETTAWYIAAAGGQNGNTPAIALGQGIVVTDGEGREVFITTKVPKNRRFRTVRLAEGDGASMVRDAGATDTWEISRDTIHPEHPTQKPVALAERAIRNSAAASDVVLDPFLGSGTTLIACERLGRRCYAMEIEPRYVDVAVRRWEEFTGEKAKRG